jgi:hypothetical protein
MKSIKIVALIIGAIASFPSVSHAGNLSANEQSVDLSSTTIGNNNVSSTTIQQRISDLQKAGRHGDNVSGTRQAVTGRTETVGDYNVHVQDLKQKYGSIQKSK